MFDEDNEEGDSYTDQNGNVFWGREAEEARHNDEQSALAESMNPFATDDPDSDSLF